MKTANLTKATTNVENQNNEMNETLEQKIARLKAEYEAQLAELKDQAKKLKDQAKALKEEQDANKKALDDQKAKQRAERMKELLSADNEPKVNKSQVIRELMAQGLTKDEIVTKTGYSNKFVLDNMWRIEKSLGLR